MTEISVVVPIFNAEKTLERCLDSILNQTFKEFEVICINDGSKDKSIDILKKYHEKDNRIKIVEQENKGLSATRNVGIRMATGNYVTFVDSDDWLEKDTFEKVKKQIDEKYEIIRIEYRINNDEKKDVQYDRDMIFDSKQIRSEVIPKLLKGKILAYSVLLYIKLETLKKNNWFFNEETYYMEDMEYFLNISYECVNMYLKKDILYHYFYNKDGMTKSKKNYEKNIINILKMHDKIISILKEKDENYEERRRIVDTMYANDALNYAYLSYKDNNNSKIFDNLEMIMQSEQFNEMKKNFLYNLLPIHLRMQLLIAKTKRKNLIKVYFIIRKYISSIKNYINKK